MENQSEVIKINPNVQIDNSIRGEFDIQIETAKKYPRDLSRVKNNCLAIISMDKDIAASCRYSLPRGGSSINGPSVHLARIISQQFGNLRVKSRVVDVSETEIKSEAVCFDLENNYACSVEVTRSIMQNEWVNGKKTGRKIRMNEDMIVVTGNAANSISMRNAIFNVVPKGLVDLLYSASIKVIAGDLSDEQKIISARKKALDYFKQEYNISTEQVISALGLRSENQIKTEQIVELRGMMQSLKDGDATIDEMFGLSKKEEPVKTEPIISKPKKDEAKNENTATDKTLPEQQPN